MINSMTTNTSKTSKTKVKSVGDTIHETTNTPDIPVGFNEMDQISRDLMVLLKISNINLLDALTNDCKCSVCQRTRDNAVTIKRIIESIPTE